MFIHIINNNGKFVPHVKKLFESGEAKEHQFYSVICSEGSDRQSDDPIIHDAHDLVKFNINWSRCDGVFLHGVINGFEGLAKILPPRVSLCWDIWGAEGYSLVMADTSPLLGPLTREFVQKLPRNSRILSRVKTQSKRAIFKLQGIPRSKRRLLQRINYAICRVREEIDYLRNSRLLRDGFKIHEISIVAIGENDFGNIRETYANSRDDILVGNSATETNNHLEVFERLRRMNVAGRKILVPLSYGDSEYRTEIIKKGKGYFGSDFVPIVNFMPYREFLGQISTCGYAFMNHSRQQGVGTTLSCITRGLKVYLSEGPIFAGYSRLGIHLGRIGNSYSAGGDQLQALNESRKSENIKIAKKHFGWNSSVKRIRDLLAAMRISSRST